MSSTLPSTCGRSSTDVEHIALDVRTILADLENIALYVRTILADLENIALDVRAGVADVESIAPDVPTIVGDLEKLRRHVPTIHSELETLLSGEENIRAATSPSPSGAAMRLTTENARPTMDLVDSPVPSSPAPRALRGAALEFTLRSLQSGGRPTVGSGVFECEPLDRPAPSRRGFALSVADGEEPVSAGPPAMRPEELARWRGLS